MSTWEDDVGGSIPFYPPEPGEPGLDDFMFYINPNKIQRHIFDMTRSQVEWRLQFSSLGSTEAEWWRDFFRWWLGMTDEEQQRFILAHKLVANEP